jgi:hypothetical protein
MTAIKALPASDPESFFQQAAIHGFPFIPYRGAVNPSDPFDVSKWNRSDPMARWGGFCPHRAVHFLTWHRAEMLELERVRGAREESPVAGGHCMDPSQPFCRPPAASCNC